MQERKQPAEHQHDRPRITQFFIPKSGTMMLSLAQGSFLFRGIKTLSWNKKKNIDLTPMAFATSRSVTEASTGALVKWSLLFAKAALVVS